LISIAIGLQKKKCLNPRIQKEIINRVTFYFKVIAVILGNILFFSLNDHSLKKR
jgi:hypothetical protein